MSAAPPVRVGPATKLVRAGGSVTVNSDGSMTLAPASGKTINLSGFTAGSILFAGAAGAISQDNAGLSYTNGALTTPVLDKGGAVYNVKAYGVRGDGTTDDTAAIQALFDAVAGPTGLGGGVVWFPPGTYIVSTLTIYSNLNIVGSGPNVTIIKKKNATAGDIFKGYNFDALTGQQVAKTISGATNATPIVLTVTGHGLVTGIYVMVSGVGGNTAANGYWYIVVIDANTFSLFGSVGNGAYTSGGTVDVFDGIHNWRITSLSINGNNLNPGNAQTALTASASSSATTLTVTSTTAFPSSGSLILRNNLQLISGATNATPIVITANGHGLTTGNTVIIESVTGNTAANGTWTVTVIDANTFSLNTSVGNGTYGAGSGYVGKNGGVSGWNLPSEVVSYTGKTGTTFTGVTRGQEHTVAMPHATGNTVALRSTSGYGIRVYGYDFVLDDVHISFCEQDGVYSEWSQTASVTFPDSMDATVISVKTHENLGHGLQWRGPHDTNMFGVQSYLNGLNGMQILDYSGGNQYVGCHSYGGQNYSWWVHDASILSNCVGETAWFGQLSINRPQVIVTGSSFFAATNVYFKGIILNCSNNQIQAIIRDCQAGSIDFTGDTGGNQVMGTVVQQAGSFFVGQPHITTDLILSPKGTATLPAGFEPVALAGPMIVNGQLVVGGTAALLSQSVLEIQSAVTADPAIILHSTSGAVSLTNRISNGLGVCRWFVVGAAGAFMAGTVAGDTGLIVDSSGKQFHIGGTAKVVTVTQDNKLGFFAATPVVQQANTLTARGVLEAFGLLATGGTPDKAANGRVTANVTINSTTMANLTGLSFAIGASEVWTGDVFLQITGNTNGLKFDATGPASPTDLLLHFFGNTSGITAFSTDSVTAFSTATTTVFVSTTAAKQFVHVRFSINNGANAGTVQFRAGTLSGTNSSTVTLNSFLRARRVA